MFDGQESNSALSFGGWQLATEAQSMANSQKLNVCTYSSGRMILGHSHRAHDHASFTEHAVPGSNHIIRMPFLLPQTEFCSNAFRNK
jgi:hypothetical protein